MAEAAAWKDTKLESSGGKDPEVAEAAAREGSQARSRLTQGVQGRLAHSHSVSGYREPEVRLFFLGRERREYLQGHTGPAPGQDHRYLRLT